MFVYFFSKPAQTLTLETAPGNASDSGDILITFDIDRFYTTSLPFEYVTDPIIENMTRTSSILK